MSSDRTSILRTDAVVLRSVDYGETSRIVTLFTRDRGKLGVMARGARATKSRFGATLEPMAYIQAVIHLKPSRELQTLSETAHMRIFPRIPAALDRLGAAVRSVELLAALMQAEQALPGALDLMVEALDALDTTSGQAANAWPWFALRMAHLVGLSPAIEKRDVEAIGAEGWLSPATGSVTPERAQGGGVRAGRAALRAFAVCARSDLQTVLRMRVEPPVRHELEGLVDGFLRYHVEEAYPTRAARVFERMAPY